MTDLDLLASVLDTTADYYALGNESFVAHGAHFVRSRVMPGRYDANHIDRVRTSDAAEMDELFRRMETEFGGYAYRRVDIDGLTPPQFEARLALEDGYRRWGSSLHLLLEGELRADPRPHIIREVLSESDWATLAHLYLLDAQEDNEKHNRETYPNRVNEFVAYVRAKSPAVRFWLAYVDGVASSYLNSWPGLNGVGQVEDLFTLPQYRHRGIATALMAHCVADARARGAGPVVISADPDDTPKHIYDAMGFRPFAVSHHYVKQVKSPS